MVQICSHIPHVTTENDSSRCRWIRGDCDFVNHIIIIAFRCGNKRFDVWAVSFIDQLSIAARQTSNRLISTRKRELWSYFWISHGLIGIFIRKKTSVIPLSRIRRNSNADAALCQLWRLVCTNRGVCISIRRRCWEHNFRPAASENVREIISRPRGVGHLLTAGWKQRQLLAVYWHLYELAVIKDRITSTMAWILLAEPPPAS